MIGAHQKQMLRCFWLYFLLSGRAEKNPSGGFMPVGVWGGCIEKRYGLSI
jgi:hypothetical protein